MHIWVFFMLIFGVSCGILGFPATFLGFSVFVLGDLLQIFWASCSFLVLFAFLGSPMCFFGGFLADFYVFLQFLAFLAGF